jgi:thiamine-monophosphate kinase
MQAMSLGEFDLIDRFFKRPPTGGATCAVVGNGDDCAVIAPTPGMHLALSTDTLVDGRHFLSTVAPERLGHKALAVNLSDLAACGARPRAFTLALTLPGVNEAWLAAFSGGLLALADQHGCELIGGDTTSGPLSITITVLGEVPAGQALLRSGAQAGDDCWVSGQPGEARLALEAFRGQWQPPLSGEAFEAARARMECPTPRVELGLALRGLATSAIDLSDGLLGDLAHVLKASGVGALIGLDLLPRSPLLQARPADQQLEAILAGGDDYELLFTAPARHRDQVQALSTALSLPLTRIGVIEAQGGLRLCQGSLTSQPPALVPNRWTSFDHFKA